MELLWTAALWVGEGSYLVLKGRSRKDGTAQTELSIGMYDQGAIKRAGMALSGVTGKPVRILGFIFCDGLRKQYRIQLWGRQAEECALALLPHIRKTLKEKQFKRVLKQAGRL